MGLDWDKVREEAAQILSDYIKVDTTNPPGKEMAGVRYLQGILEREGFPTIVLESQPDRGNLICPMKGTDGLSPLILLHHIDVVPAEAEKWMHPPYSGLVVNREIWGRGAQDCKSLGVIELVAFLLLKREGFRPKRDILYMAAADEETGGKWGVGWLFQNHPEMMKAEYVINEGGGVGMIIGKRNVYTCQTAEKGICWLKLTFRGKPGHGSVPHDDNCIEKMARAIERISSYRSPLRRTLTTENFIKGIAEEQNFPRSFLMKQLLYPFFSKSVEKRIPDPGLRGMVGAILRNTFVPTVVQGGQKTNVIPSECSCQVDCRILPGVEPEMIKAEVRNLLFGIKDYEVEILQTSAASESPTDNAFYRILENTLKRLDPKAKMIPAMLSGATDSRFFRSKGTAAYGFQPMAPMDNLSEYLSRVHGHDERISAESLLFGTRVLYEMLKDFCG
ncbi:MAG: M20/M25/M40 family metallo-hydrolase [Deltaproteobacteria bacterium]|nr:M20/M25/M40 family metallo-hydrolase [Deltaproteobacteria bacterium]